MSNLTQLLIGKFSKALSPLLLSVSECLTRHEVGMFSEVNYIPPKKNKRCLYL